MELFAFLGAILVVIAVVLYRNRTRGRGQEGNYVAGDHSEPTEYLGAGRMATGRTGHFPGHIGGGGDAGGSDSGGSN